MSLVPVRPSKIFFDFWAIERPKTGHWGSGDVWQKMERRIGRPTAAFGKTDGIPSGVASFDLKNGFDWKNLPLPPNSVKFGYWDPPYDSLYKKEGQEIWRVCRRLAILHTHIWPRAWLDVVSRSRREAMVAITMGPMKQIRCLQVFRKAFTVEPKESPH